MVRKPTQDDARAFGYKSMSDMEHKIKWYNQLFGGGFELKSSIHGDTIASAFVDPTGHVLITS